MQKITIPNLGEEIALAEDWTFSLKSEQRNESLYPDRFIHDGWRERVTHLIWMEPGKTTLEHAKRLIGLPKNRPATDFELHLLDKSSKEYYKMTERIWMSDWHKTRVPASLSYLPPNNIRPKEPLRFILPAETRLVVDRIYVRKGAPDYASVTFRIKSSPQKELNKKRFFVSLSDANKILFKEEE